MKKLNILLPIFALFFLACNSGQPVPEKSATNAPEQVAPVHFSADSMEVIYYKDTSNLRYFTLAETTDAKQIAAVLASLRDTLPKENPCLKEGKIYLFEKGAVVNTLYFVSDRESCNYLSYIKNGVLIRFQLTDGAADVLSSLKLGSTEPPAEK